MEGQEDTTDLYNSPRSPKSDPKCSLKMIVPFAFGVRRCRWDVALRGGNLAKAWTG